LGGNHFCGGFLVALGYSLHHGAEAESLYVLFLLPELSAMVQKPSLTKQLSPLRFFDDFLFLQ
jgi:hypothetical protein